MPPWLLFPLLTFAVSLPLYLQLRRIDPLDLDRAPIERAVRQLMWVPGIVALGLIIYNRTDPAVLNLGPGRHPWLLLAALLIPLAMEFLLVFAALRFSLARLDRELFSVRDGWITLHPSVRLLLGHQKQTAFKFIINVIATVGVAAAFSLVFAFSEELGWRGVLQGQFIDQFTLTWGMVLGGLLWGLWYAPAVLRGYRFRAFPRLGAFVFMPIFAIAAGIVTGWLYWLSGSLWVAAIFNASLKVSATISEVALGEAGGSRRVRILWLWLWSVLAGLALTLWYAGL